ncbi:Hsp20/alpha crystallin family protein [Deferribacteraceae bacterium V6Fe1]|nr:Hsp20/alpha crystallin family protein [Deferribacteraceae bacterium V6Fe1]
MAIVRWDPFKDIMSLQERINKIFDETVQQDRKSQYGDWYPPVDIFEKEDGITIIMEIPGVSESDIDLQITDGVLTVRGEKKLPYEKNNENFYRLERNFGKFARSFSLPNTVDQNKVKASLKEGILKIEIGKKDEIKPKVIKVEKED